LCAIWLDANAHTNSNTKIFANTAASTDSTSAAYFITSYLSASRHKYVTTL
jgi:hypothetical protein